MQTRNVLMLSLALLAGTATFTLTPRQEPQAPALTKKQKRKKVRTEWRLKSLRDEHGRIPDDAVMRAKAQMEAMAVGPMAARTAGLDPAKWTEHGPGNFGGRTRALVIHPTKANVMWTGGVSGGIWKTTNGGMSWSPADDLLENLAITSIVMDPRNPNVLYAGTGEREGSWGSIRGAGIFKSTDGGVKWTRLASTKSAAFHFVNRLAISPDGKVLLAALGNGDIVRSTDGGATWTPTFQSSITVPVWEVVFHPTNSRLAVGAVTDLDANSNVEVYGVYSTDGGATWSRATGIGSKGEANRIVLAYHGGYTLGNGMVYGIEYRADMTPTQTRIWRSADGGKSYTLLATNRILGDQGSYDSTLWVNPADANNDPKDDVVIAGGILFWRSTDGGVTWKAISMDSAASRLSAHNDEHVVVAHPAFDGKTNKTVFVGTDGGIYRADDIFTVTPAKGWVDLRRSLSITQFYGGARGPTGVLYGGSQDNGTVSLQPGKGLNDWEEAAGGDGTFAAADPTDARYLYGAYPEAAVHRSSDGGKTTQDISAGLPDAGNGALAGFVSPLVLDPNEPRRLYVGTVRLWKTVDARAANVVWKVVKPKRADGAKITAIAVAHGNPDRVFVGYESGMIEATANATAASPTWTVRHTGLPFRYVTRITIDPADERHVFACFGGFTDQNVWESNDGGASWKVLKTTPLQAPVRDVEVNPWNPSWLYAATESGLIVSTDGGASWSSAATPTRAPIDELFWSDTKLWLVSHGRGFFSQRPCGSVRQVGQGCVAIGGGFGPDLDADRAMVGRTTTLTVDGAPAGASLGSMLIGVQAASPIALGPNCKVYLDVLNAPIMDLGTFAISGGKGTFSLPIPNDPTLQCKEAALQAVVVLPGDLALSNGVILDVGG